MFKKYKWVKNYTNEYFYSTGCEKSKVCETRVKTSVNEYIGHFNSGPVREFGYSFK